MGNVILVRHPRTALNKSANADSGGESAERIRGWADVPLDKVGLREADTLAAEHGSKDLAKVYCSDLTRAKQTGIGIARTAKTPCVGTEQLRPWGLGILTAKKVDEVIPLMNKLVEHPDVKIPDGDTSRGESFGSFRDRFIPFLQRIMGEAKASNRDVLAVTHSRNIQLYKAWDKAGRPDSGDYDVKRMLDYNDEVPPSGHITVKT